MSNWPRRQFYWIILLITISACVRAADLPATRTPPTSAPDQLPSTQNTNETVAAPVSSPQALTPAPASLSGEVPESQPAITEQAVRLISLAGPIQSAEAEISGMTWVQETLILLPQFPERFGDQSADGYLFGIQKSTLLNYLESADPQPITPQPIPFIANELSSLVPGYEGFESIVVSGDQAYLTIETSRGSTQGRLVMANILAGLQAIVVNTATIVEIPSTFDSPNHSYEALLVFGRRLVTLHETNGAAINPSPIAPTFDLDLALADNLSFPNIEFRVTDATDVDENGRFWVINYFFPGDLSLYADDPLGAEYGSGKTHSQGITIERLLELQFTEAGIELASGGYILLQLGEAARNWEALARLEQRGFLIATDKFPSTLFGFVETPITP